MNKTEKATLVYIDFVFIAVCVLAAATGRLPEIPSGGLFLIILGLAAYRGGRAVSYNLIFKWVRDALGVTEEADSSGAGNSNVVDPKKVRGVKYILAELICCPICSSTWAGVLLLAVWAIVPAFGAVLLYALAAAGIAEVLTWVSEYFEWAGRSAREVSGSLWISKNVKTPNYEVNKDILFSRMSERENGGRRVQ